MHAQRDKGHYHSRYSPSLPPMHRMAQHPVAQAQAAAAHVCNLLIRGRRLLSPHDGPGHVLRAGQTSASRPVAEQTDAHSCGAGRGSCGDSRGGSGGSSKGQPQVNGGLDVHRLACACACLPNRLTLLKSFLAPKQSGAKKSMTLKISGAVGWGRGWEKCLK